MEEKKTKEKRFINSILLLEPNNKFSNYLKVNLEWLEYRTFVGFNYNDGISLLESHVPDLILLETNLGKKSGVKVLHYIKEHHTYKDIPIIIISSSTSRKTFLDVYALGVDDYILKPFDFDTLLGRIKKLESGFELEHKLTLKKTKRDLNLELIDKNICLTILGEIGDWVLDAYRKAIIETNILKNPYQEFIIDLHFQKSFNKGKLKIITDLLKIIPRSMPRIITGRNYSNLITLDVDYAKQLFLTMNDFTKFIAWTKDFDPSHSKKSPQKK
jgi:response regulator RpfG family c-di-GMP phosphodiesterase